MIEVFASDVVSVYVERTGRWFRGRVAAVGGSGFGLAVLVVEGSRVPLAESSPVGLVGCERIGADTVRYSAAGGSDHPRGGV